jgi:hypothetical protein
MALSRPNVAQDFIQRDNDLYISPVTGDFVIGPSDNQHIEDLLASAPGHWKEFPQVGANVPLLLKGRANVQEVEGRIKLELEADGYQVRRPSIKVTANGNATITPNAIRISR